MKKEFGFFKHVMHETRKADYYLGCLGGSVFLDFNKSSEGLISLCRISFDGYGCYTITNSNNVLNYELSQKFIKEIDKNDIEQEKLTALVIELIKINQEYIGSEVLEEYDLIAN